MFVDKLKAEILSATKAKDEVKRDILKLVLSEAQAIEGSKNRKGGKPLSDEEYYPIMQQMISNNAITLGYSRNLQFTEVLEQEIKILRELIVDPLSQSEIEAELLNSDNSEVEQIIAAKADGMAIGIAVKFMKTTGKYFLSEDVKTVVSKMRSIS